MTFGALFRSARRAAPTRVTLADVAAVTGKSISYLSNVENGRRRPPEAQLVTVVAERLFRTDPTPLLRAAAAERDSTFRLHAGTPEKVELLAGLARRLEHMTPEQVERVMLSLRDEDEAGRDAG